MSNVAVNTILINIEGAIFARKFRCFLKKIGQKRSLYIGIGKFNMTGKCLSRPGGGVNRGIQIRRSAQI